jgi:hypothetical protein
VTEAGATLILIGPSHCDGTKMQQTASELLINLFYYNIGHY